MGSADLFLAWYPASFGTVEWEFGAISASLNGMALPSLGLFLLLASAIGDSRRLLTRVIAIAMALLVVVVLALAVIYATDAPVALGAISGNPAVLSTLKKSVAKSSALFLVYLALYSFGAVYGWRASRPITTG
jgi:hypothetical protein